jgi:hypothetical protein
MCAPIAQRSTGTLHARKGAVFRRLTGLMREDGWEPIRTRRHRSVARGTTKSPRSLHLDQHAALRNIRHVLARRDFAPGIHHRYRCASP